MEMITLHMVLLMQFEVYKNRLGFSSDKNTCNAEYIMKRVHSEVRIIHALPVSHQKETNVAKHVC